MGALYSEGLVFPLYLADYAEAVLGGHEDADAIRSARPSDDTAARLALALRRGWIQQEIGSVLSHSVPDFYLISFLSGVSEWFLRTIPHDGSHTFVYCTAVPFDTKVRPP
jgi:hypothetical protein